MYNISIQYNISYRVLYRLVTLVSSMNVAVHMCHFTNEWGRICLTKKSVEDLERKKHDAKGNALSFSPQNILQTQSSEKAPEKSSTALVKFCSLLSQF